MAAKVPRLNLARLDAQQPEETELEEDQRLLKNTASGMLTMVGACALSTAVLRSWRYRDHMPIVGVIGIGLVSAGALMEHDNTINGLAAAVGLALGPVLAG